MGDGVTDEQELVITIGSGQAGGKQGQVIMEDITYNAERDNTHHHGLGNDESQGISYGNKTQTVDSTQTVNETVAGLIDDYMGDGTLTGSIEMPNKTVDLGKLHWNNLELEASDGDGAPTLSVSFDVTEADTETPSEDAQ